MPVYDMCEGHPRRITPEQESEYPPEIDYAGWHPDVNRLVRPVTGAPVERKPHPMMIARLLRQIGM